MEAFIYTVTKEVDGLKVTIKSETNRGISYFSCKTLVFIPWSNIDRIEYISQ